MADERRTDEHPTTPHERERAVPPGDPYPQQRTNASEPPPSDRTHPSTGAGAQADEPGARPGGDARPGRPVTPPADPTRPRSPEPGTVTGTPGTTGAAGTTDTAGEPRTMNPTEPRTSGMWLLWLFLAIAVALVILWIFT